MKVQRKIGFYTYSNTYNYLTYTMLTKVIYPLRLRERISWRLKKLNLPVKYLDVPLFFNKNLRLDLAKNDCGHLSIIYNGFYELELSKSIIKLASKGGLLVDVGANYGYFSCLWAAQNPNNQVVAFEASPVNVEPLKNNVHKNMLSQVITVVPMAMGKEKGRLKFELANESQQTGWGGFTVSDSTSSVEVEVETLDNYTSKNNIEKIEVLKIDTEGADTWVLYGAGRLLKERKIAHIFYEHNLTRMKLLNIGVDEAKAFLLKYGYAIEQTAPCEFHAYPKA